MRHRIILLGTLTILSVATVLVAHPISFNSSMTYSAAQPSGSADSIANWTGAAFDAANIGGSGVNANGGSDNGYVNDASTYVANNQPIQGQTILTGNSPQGYLVESITVRMAGYTSNIAAAPNDTSWNLNAQNGPIILTIGKVDGSSLVIQSMQNFTAGANGNPGTGHSANGAGTYITFQLPFTVHLQPNTTYAFDFIIGNGGANFFEWLGIGENPYSGGTAYTRNGLAVTGLAGDRVFMVNLVPGAPLPFAHPGTLHTQADLDRMKAKIAANEQPWVSGYSMLLSSPYNNLGWPAYNVDYIVRGPSGNNYTRSQQDAQLIYTQALIWHLTGNTAYADRAVLIANVWSDLLGVTGDSNQSLAAGICGYLFAISGELLSAYPGWPQAQKQAYKDMMMRVFYPANFDYLWRHHDTFITKGGNTHYRLNWDSCNMASMAAIGILCDNRAVYEQAVDYFKYGPGNGRIERAAWYIHPDGMSQTEEIGRDQGHNLGGWYSMALLCQTAWNQGDDLWGYDNNRVLRAMEHTTKWNMGYDVPWAFHRNCDLTYTESLSLTGRGALGMFHELAYNHYVNIKGLAAPYTQAAAEQVRPERWPNTGYHPSEVDWFGHGSLTFTRDPITSGAAPNGLRANWSENQITLYWWGSAGATDYTIKRSTTAGGPYVTIGRIGPTDTTFSDSDVVNGTTYYYVVSSITPDGEKESDELAVAQTLVAQYPFDGSTNDAAGDRNGVLKGGSTGLPVFVAGKIGQAVSFDGVDDYIQLPAGIANYQDITIAAWVYWNGGGNWQRIFDFGTDIEKNIFLTPSNGGSMRFSITTSRGADGTGVLDGPIMAANQWVHVAVTLNGDTGTLYVNAKPVDTDIINRVDPLFGQVYCYLGRSMWNADPLYKGRLDDFRIYNYALSGSEIWDLWGQSANRAPTFAADWMSLTVVEDSPFAASVAVQAADLDGQALTFSKVTGPSWLSVSPNGALSGTPSNAQVGDNVFVIRAADPAGATDDTTLSIAVANVYSGVRGLEDLAGLVSEWLAFNCADIPACGGGDLTGDQKVNLPDFEVLSKNWLGD